MKSVSLTFELLYDFKWFTITFESESPKRNRLMDLVYDGFKLDTPNILSTHFDLYQKIKFEMSSRAREYWSEQGEVNEIPTLAYQQPQFVDHV